MKAIMTNVPMYWATVSATERAELAAVLAGQRPGQPPAIKVLDQDQNSLTFLQQIDAGDCLYLTSTAAGHEPFTVAGRTTLVKFRRAAELIVSGEFVVSSCAEIEQELARQQSRKTAADAEDLRLSKGKQTPFLVSLPGTGTK